jgi:hypothetical protein
MEEMRNCSPGMKAGTYFTLRDVPPNHRKCYNIGATESDSVSGMSLPAHGVRQRGQKVPDKGSGELARIIERVA